MDDHFFDTDPQRMPLGKLVSWVGGAMQAHFRRAVARQGATGTAVSVLGVLGHSDGHSQRELAGRVGLTPPTLTPVLDGLERDGHVRRERDPTDRRIVRIYLTPDGEAHLREVFAQVAVGFRDRMPHPSPEDARIIRDYLVAVLDAVTDHSRCPDASHNGADGPDSTEGVRR